MAETMKDKCETIKKAAEDVPPAITLLSQIQFRYVYYFIPCAFFCLFLHFALSAKNSVLYENAFVTLVLFSVPLTYPAYENEWKQVAVNMLDVVTGIKDVLKKKLYWWLFVKLLSYTPDMITVGKNYLLSKGQEYCSKIWSFISWASSSILPSARSNSESSSTSESSNHLSVKERLITCHMGFVVVTLVLLATKQLLYLLRTRLMSILFGVFLTVIHAVLQELYIFNVIHFIVVFLLSIAAVVFYATYETNSIKTSQ